MTWSTTLFPLVHTLCEKKPVSWREKCCVFDVHGWMMSTRRSRCSDCVLSLYIASASAHCERTYRWGKRWLSIFSFKLPFFLFFFKFFVTQLLARWSRMAMDLDSSASFPPPPMYTGAQTYSEICTGFSNLLRLTTSTLPPLPLRQKVQI